MNDILIPLCKRYGLNLVTGMGELSLTSCLWLVERVRDLKKPTRILYLSDFDPAGLSMPVAVSRKIEKFIIDYGTPDMDIKLLPVVLSHEQCKKYQLPRTPLKESELRAGRFQERFGEGATELDALEAIHPGELDRILRKHISRYRDAELQEKMDDIRESIQNTFDSFRESILEEYAEEIVEIEREYKEISDEYAGRFSLLKERVQSLWQEIADEIGYSEKAIREFLDLLRNRTNGMDAENPDLSENDQLTNQQPLQDFAEDEEKETNGNSLGIYEIDKRDMYKAMHLDDQYKAPISNVWTKSKKTNEVGHFGNSEITWLDIQNRMEQVDIDLSWVDPPDHDPDEGGQVVLFDSGRDYFEQLHEYKVFQGKAA